MTSRKYGIDEPLYGSFADLVGATRKRAEKNDDARYQEQDRRRVVLRNPAIIAAKKRIYLSKGFSNEEADDMANDENEWRPEFQGLGIPRPYSVMMQPGGNMGGARGRHVRGVKQSIDDQAEVSKYAEGFQEEADRRRLKHAREMRKEFPDLAQEYKEPVTGRTGQSSKSSPYSTRTGQSVRQPPHSGSRKTTTAPRTGGVAGDYFGTESSAASPATSGVVASNPNDPSYWKDFTVDGNGFLRKNVGGVWLKASKDEAGRYLQAQRTNAGRAAQAVQIENAIADESKAGNDLKAAQENYFSAAAALSANQKNPQANVQQFTENKLRAEQALKDAQSRHGAALDLVEGTKEDAGANYFTIDSAGNVTDRLRRSQPIRQPVVRNTLYKPETRTTYVRDPMTGNIVEYKGSSDQHYAETKSRMASIDAEEKRIRAENPDMPLEESMSIARNKINSLPKEKWALGGRKSLVLNPPVRRPIQEIVAGIEQTDLGGDSIRELTGSDDNIFDLRTNDLPESVEAVTVPTPIRASIAPRAGSSNAASNAFVRDIAGVSDSGEYFEKSEPRAITPVTPIVPKSVSRTNGSDAASNAFVRDIAGISDNGGYFEKPTPRAVTQKAGNYRPTIDKSSVDLMLPFVKSHIDLNYGGSQDYAPSYIGNVLRGKYSPEDVYKTYSEIKGHRNVLPRQTEREQFSMAGKSAIARPGLMVTSGKRGLTGYQPVVDFDERGYKTSGGTVLPYSDVDVGTTYFGEDIYE